MSSKSSSGHLHGWDEYEASLEEKLGAIEFELRDVEAKIQSLQERKNTLQKMKDQIKDEMLLKKSQMAAEHNWDGKDFAWSKKLDENLLKVFGLNDYRPLQLSTINAVLSKQDVILIMPTGGGKSLCYQLPGVISSGVTLVVSPLVALMEDQIMSLKSLNVPAEMLTASSTKEQVNSIQAAMVDSKAPLKLLYVTPEKLAKSKRFMSKLQKMYTVGRLSLLAIDEVHCCSQWGHDFRPDYKFLGVLKAMFPDVPILGLTATATSKVITDVQKMLNIQGCLVLKASFNRPNLYYEVRPKPSSQSECIAELEDLLKHRFAGKSGIIYTTSIKDCGDLMQELRGKGLAIGMYHANLDASLRSRCHSKWLSGEYQAVVATIAFGLGIDKPDVRFVIHHALSKSMENFYQESGRAGRDGKPSDCILFYRFGDIFRLSTMVFTQQTGLENLYGIVAYCLDAKRCRRSIIASHFGEEWEPLHCKRMCDHCREPHESKEVDIAKYCRHLYQIIQNASKGDVKLTGQMLVDAWLGKGKANLRMSDIPTPKFSREMCETIIAHLLVEGYLQEDFHFTPYSTISYIKKGPRAANALVDGSCIMIGLAGRKIIPSVSNKISSIAHIKSEVLNKECTNSKLSHSASVKSGESRQTIKDNHINSYNTTENKKIENNHKPVKNYKSSKSDVMKQNESSESILQNRSIFNQAGSGSNAVTIEVRDSESDEEMINTSVNVSIKKRKRYISSSSSD